MAHSYTYIEDAANYIIDKNCRIINPIITINNDKKFVVSSELNFDNNNETYLLSYKQVWDYKKRGKSGGIKQFTEKIAKNMLKYYGIEN